MIRVMIEGRDANLANLKKYTAFLDQIETKMKSADKGLLTKLRGFASDMYIIIDSDDEYTEYAMKILLNGMIEIHKEYKAVGINEAMSKAISSITTKMDKLSLRSN